MHKCHRAAAALIASIASATTFAQQPAPSQQPAVQNQAPSANGPSAPAIKPGQGLPPNLFADVLDTQMPLSEGQVRELNRQADKIKKARSARPDVMPSPVSQTLSISLAPGKASQVVRLAANMVTTLVFTDVTGAPWPIAKIIMGNDSAFGVPEGIESLNTNMLPIFVKEEYGTTNLTILLKDAPAPIVMTLVTGQREVDYRLDLTVQARGPNAKAPVMSDSFGEGTAVSTDLVAILDGIAPSGSTLLRTSHPEVQAWAYGKKVYVRTRMNLLSPRNLNSASSADGTKVYEIVQTPVVMVLSGGKVISVSLAGMPAPTHAAQALVADKLKP